MSPRGKNATKMNVPSGEDVLAALRQLEQGFRTGVDCDSEDKCIFSDDGDDDEAAAGELY